LCSIGRIALFIETKGHTQRPIVTGDVQTLSGVIYHDDRKPLGRWLVSQRRYAKEEAKYLLQSDRKSLGLKGGCASWDGPRRSSF
jgi:hypothetical protein